MADPPFRIRRSALYLPASNPRAIEKARQLDADVIILDLEDAVAPDAKDEARRLAVEAVSAGGFRHAEVVIRCNGLDTPWGADDVAACVVVAPDGVLVPKVDSPEDVARYRTLLGADGPPLWLMIETARCLFALREIAVVSDVLGVSAWAMGTNDLAKEIRARLTLDRASLASALTMAVAAARIGGVDILDGVFNDIDDVDAFGAGCEQGRDFGFDGKTLIHPTQIAPCNRLFAPSAVDLAWARAVIDAFALPENRAAGALRVDGKMTERLHLAQAERMMAQQAAIGRRH